MCWNASTQWPDGNSSESDSASGIFQCGGGCNCAMRSDATHDDESRPKGKLESHCCLGLAQMDGLRNQFIIDSSSVVLARAPAAPLDTNGWRHVGAKLAADLPGTRKFSSSHHLTRVCLCVCGSSQKQDALAGAAAARLTADSSMRIKESGG